VRHDFDPQTNTVRLYLQRDLIQPVVLVNIHVRDATTGQLMVANWHFNYAVNPGAPSGIHAPIAPAKTPALHLTPTASTATNAPAVAEPEPLEKSAVGTPLDTHPTAPPASPSVRD